jgi:RIO kinase 2
MLLDTKAMRYLTADDWKVLTAVEIASKNHELVPTALIEKSSRIRGGASGVQRSISALAKAGLIARIKEARYDGYRLTYGGLDYLAVHTHVGRNDIYSVGTRVGVGKESDIMVVADETGTQRVLKIHRLGRISFRSVKSNRDYLKKGAAAGSWMYLSKLSAMKEFAFMKALQDEGFLVPNPIAHSRHTVLMEYCDAIPLRQISSVPDPASLYADLIALILRLARHGLIHGDFNEFNILIKEEVGEALEGSDELPVTLVPILIDFPQMVSMLHANAEMYFDRDVACVKRFFERRFHFVSDEPGPFFKDAKESLGQDGATRLDAVSEASGFTKKMNKDLEAAIRSQYGEKDNKKEDDADEDSDEAEQDDEHNSDGEQKSQAGNEAALCDTETAVILSPQTDTWSVVSLGSPMLT